MDSKNCAGLRTRRLRSLAVSGNICQTYATVCFIGALGALVSITACSESDGRRQELAGGSIPPPGSPPPSGEPGAPGTTEEQPLPSYSVSIEVGATDLLTKGAGQNECTAITATISNGDNPAPDVEVLFAAIGSTEGKESGAVNPSTATTNASGVATSSYCSGKDENKVVAKATAGSTSANSAEITVVSVPTYRLSWKNKKSRSFAQLSRDLSADPEKLGEHLLQGPPRH